MTPHAIGAYRHGVRWCLAATMVTAAGVVANVPPAVAADAKRAGDAIVVVSPNSSQRLSQGGSATHFSIELPHGAACQGDSANAGYRVQSFVVPSAQDPGAVRYQLNGPDLPGSWGLYDLSGEPFTQVQTSQADAPGGSGRIINVPTFSYEVLRPGNLSEGRYRIGVACSLYNETTRYWDTELVVAKDAADKPAELHWTVTGVRAATATSNAPIVGVVVVALAAAGVAVGVGRRRRSGRSSRRSVSR